MDGKREIGWTTAGLQLLLVSSVLSIVITLARVQVLYSVQLMAFVLYVLGVLCVILGRKIFGPKHSTLTLLAPFFIVLGNFFFLPSLPGHLVFFLLNAMAGIANVLLTFELQDEYGHILQVLGYGAGLAWAGLILLESSTGVGLVPPLFDLLLTVTPTIIITVTFYLALSRVRMGKIPVPLLDMRQH